MCPQLKLHLNTFITANNGLTYKCKTKKAIYAVKMKTENLNVQINQFI